jgi:hypothetical protein
MPTEVRSPINTTRSSDRPLSPGARSNPSRGDASSPGEPSHGEVRTPDKPSHLGADEQAAELHITGADPTK